MPDVFRVLGTRSRRGRRGPGAWKAAGSREVERCAVGRIDYGPGIPTGILIYLKASMTGEEDTSVLQYKSAHKGFPHESTGDQFFGEDQFESYKRLGRDIADRAFAPVAAQTGIVAMAEKLLQIHSPAEQAADR